MKRTDYITWDEYFMGVAKLSGMRSKDPSTQVGACIVSRIIKFFPWVITGSPSAAPMMNSHGIKGGGRGYQVSLCHPQ